MMSGVEGIAVAVPPPGQHVLGWQSGGRRPVTAAPGETGDRGSLGSLGRQAPGADGLLLPSRDDRDMSGASDAGRAVELIPGQLLMTPQELIVFFSAPPNRRPRPQRHRRIASRKPGPGCRVGRAALSKGAVEEKGGEKGRRIAGRRNFEGDGAGRVTARRSGLSNTPQPIRQRPLPPAGGATANTAKGSLWDVARKSCLHPELQPRRRPRPQPNHPPSQASVRCMSCPSGARLAASAAVALSPSPSPAA